MRYARKRDANERAIVAALRAYGARVARLDGSGVPDLLVQFRGVLTLIEVKDVNGDRRAPIRRSDGDDGALTPAQRAWWSAWGEPLPSVVMTAEQALAAIGVTHGSPPCSTPTEPAATETSDVASGQPERRPARRGPHQRKRAR